MLHDGHGNNLDGLVALKCEPSSASTNAINTTNEPSRFLIRIPLSASLKSSLSSEVKFIAKPNPPVSPSDHDVSSSGRREEATIVGEGSDWCSTSPGGGESISANQKESGVLGTLTTSSGVTNATVTTGRKTHLGTVNYEPFKPLFSRKHIRALEGTATINVKIHGRYFKDSFNPALRKRYIFGGQPEDMSDNSSPGRCYYTDDSDSVAILLQSGFSMAVGFTTVKATFEISANRTQYVGAERNSMKSRSWLRHSGLAIRLLGHRCIPDYTRNPQRGYADGIDLRFSHRLGRPVLPFRLLQFDPNQLSQSVGSWEVTLEGPRQLYILTSDAQGLRLWRKEGGSEKVELFSLLKWEEIDWRIDGGILIRKNFFPIHSYWKSL